MLCAMRQRRQRIACAAPVKADACQCDYWRDDADESRRVAGARITDVRERPPGMIDCAA